MYIVSLIDDHPGKNHDGISAFIVKVTDLNDRFERPDHVWYTAFPVDFNTSIGMFTGLDWPVQYVVNKKDGWHFTMSNNTDIKQDEVKQLIENGKFELKYECDGVVSRHLILELL